MDTLETDEAGPYDTIVAKVTIIPGIGRTFAQDLARIGITEVSALEGQSPELLYDRLVAENTKVDHKTSKNYLYVLRMAVYYADGGRDPDKLKWHVWKNEPKE